MKQIAPSGKKSSPNGSEAPLFPALGCVIMASGLGKRFGGNKLLADWNGAPLMDRILAITDGLFARRIVITRHADVARLCHAQEVETILHDLPHRNDVVRLGIAAIGKQLNGCMFSPCDQPLLQRESIIKLCLAFEEAPEHIYRLCSENAPGTPVLFPRDCFGALACLPKGRGGSALLDEYPERVKAVYALDEWELADVDTPEDLYRLRQHFEKQRV